MADQDVINQIEYHLIEPITDFNVSPLWNGSEQFTMDSITRAIERRRNTFMFLQGTHITHSQVNYGSPFGNGRISLNDNIINIRRAAWLNTSSEYNPLWRDDEREADLLSVDWAINASTPVAYSAFLPPPVAIQIIPVSDDSGLVDLLTVNNPINLNESIGMLLNIPDDYSPIVKWGALADLLDRDSQAYDPIRADYCQKMWEEGLRFSSMIGTINQASINGIAVIPNAVVDLDSYSPDWQNLSGVPTDIAIAGRNLIALTPTPNDIYSVELDVVRNIPIPSSDGDFIPISRECYDVVLDYALHLAMFKCQGVEFMATVPLVNRFIQTAMSLNSTLRAEAKNYDIMQGYSSLEEMNRPTFEKEDTYAS